MSGGVATDQRGQRSNALSIAPSVSLVAAPGVAFQLGGSATRFATQLWSLGVDADLAVRESLGPFAAFTLNGVANVSRLGGPSAATFAQGGVTPAIEVSVSRLTLFGGGRAVTGSSSERVPSAAFPPFSRDARTVGATRSGGGLLYGAVLSLVATPTYALSMSGREDRTTVAGAAFTDRSVGLTLNHTGIALSAMAGTRRAADERLTFGSAAVSVPIAAAASFDLAAGRYASNRLLGTPAGDFVNVGLSLRIGTAPRAPGPVPANAPSPVRGVTRLAIRAGDARSVEVAGDFNEWTPVRARRAENGVWFADLRIPPGRYRYAFRVNGSEWRVPDGATAVDDGFGGKSAWLSVGESGSR